MLAKVCGRGHYRLCCVFRLKKMYEFAVEDRNYTGIQLIDRNDELCILYEKANIQVSCAYIAHTVLATLYCMCVSSMRRQTFRCRAPTLHTQSSLHCTACMVLDYVG
jgi:hypothetical protein